MGVVGKGDSYGASELPLSYGTGEPGFPREPPPCEVTLWESLGRGTHTGQVNCPFLGRWALFHRDRAPACRGPWGWGLVDLSVVVVYCVVVLLLLAGF